MDHSSDDLVEVGTYRAEAEGFQHSLVVLALGYECWLVPGAETQSRLHVRAAARDPVLAELARFDRESREWPPRAGAESPALARLDLVTPMIWAFVVLLVYREQLHHPAWTEVGALDAGAVFDRGEWWRPFTALFLHADGSHLVSNLVAGVFAFAAALSVFGRRWGWGLIGLAAVAGNLADAAVHYPGPYRSLGASTALFAAVGLLCGRAAGLTVRGGGARRWRPLFLPLATGLTVLALYGAGGPLVDVVAHVGGFGVGVVLGAVAGWGGQRPRSSQS
ncbi:MAG: rhomboid family intramembrane serine protease [Opitutales bacterium]